MSRTLLAALFLLLPVGVSVSFGAIDSTKTDNQRVPPPPIAKQRSGLFVLPVVFYKPETKIAGGVVGIYYFHDQGSSDNTRASSIQAGFLYTQRNQIITKIEPQIFLSDEKYYLTGDLSFFKYPDKFYGIGNNTPASAEEDYTPQIVRFRADAEIQVLPHFYSGGRYVFIVNKILKYDLDGVLIDRTIPGSNGATISGPGVVMKFDDRNNSFAPTRGRSYEFSILFFQKPFGSEFAYTLYTVDFRQYFSFIENQELACQIYGGFTTGTAPFQYLQRLGGEKLIRGYLEGRFIDNDYVLAQTEYRLPLFWRIGMVVFAGIGQVASAPNKLGLAEFKPSGGFGLRYAISKEERLNVRVDFGFGQDGNNGFYLTAAEAF